MDNLPVNAMATKYAPRHGKPAWQQRRDEAEQLLEDAYEYARVANVHRADTYDDEFSCKIKSIEMAEVRLNRAKELLRDLLAEHRAAMEGKR